MVWIGYRIIASANALYYLGTQLFVKRYPLRIENPLHKQSKKIVVRQKVPKWYFQSQFSVSKINQIFSKKKRKRSIYKYQFRRSFFSKIVFLNSIFEPLYFLKSCPSFKELTFPVGIFLTFFLRSMLILGQKSYFLGPAILKIPQPNWR